MAYTAFSRVSEDMDWCLANDISADRLLYINKHSELESRRVKVE